MSTKRAGEAPEKPPERKREPYRMVEPLAPRLFGIEHPKYGRQLWSAGKMRGTGECRACREPIVSGAVAYRLVNQSALNRHHRLCETCATTRHRAASRASGAPPEAP